MPNRSKISDCSSRSEIADELYQHRGAGEAAARCDGNVRFGAHDLADELVGHLALGPGLTVVDAGCGAGQHVERFSGEVGPDGSALAFDYSADAVASARARGVAAEVADAANLPLANASVDALNCAFAIYYFPDLAAALAEFTRVLAPGGRLVISGPARDTNSELYAFHQAVTGAGPSDADQLALGYLEDTVVSALAGHGLAGVELHSFTNPIQYPTADDFLSYWSATSLFARTVDEVDRATMIDQGRRQLAGASFTITKRVSILTCVRR